MCVSLVLVCKTAEKKITLKRLQRVGTVMADQEVLDIANRRTVRKGFQEWPKQMLPPNSAREGLWNCIVEPDYICALTSMIAFDLLPAPLLPCRARSSRQQRQLHGVFLLWDWEQAPLVTKSSCARYIVVAAGFKPRAKSPTHISQLSDNFIFHISLVNSITFCYTLQFWRHGLVKVVAIILISPGAK